MRRRCGLRAQRAIDGEHASPLRSSLESIANKLQAAIITIFRAHITEKQRSDMEFWSKSSRIALIPVASSFDTMRHFILDSLGQKTLNIMIRRVKQDGSLAADADMANLKVKEHTHWLLFDTWFDDEISMWPALPSSMEQWWKSNNISLTKPQSYTQLPTDKPMGHTMACSISWPLPP